MSGVVLTITPDKFKDELQHRLIREARIAHKWGPYNQEYHGGGTTSYVSHTVFIGVLTTVDRSQPACPVLIRSEFYHASIMSDDAEKVEEAKKRIFEKGDKITKALKDGEYKIAVFAGEYKLEESG